jgi:HEAT repeat protein
MAATGALARALKDEEPYVRVKSAGALYKIDRRVDVVVPILVRGLKDECLARRRGAAEALKEMGPDAKAAVTALAEAVMEDDHLTVDAARPSAPSGLTPSPRPPPCSYTPNR